MQFDVLFCGICHSDLHQVKDDFGATKFPIVPGHEIIGRVTKVGSGPYTLDRVQKGQFWTLDANPSYWKGKPRINRVVFRKFNNGDAMVSALRRGHCAPEPGGSAVATTENDGGRQRLVEPHDFGDLAGVGPAEQRMGERDLECLVATDCSVHHRDRNSRAGRGASTARGTPGCHGRESAPLPS